jgi:hypothetical protein
MRATALAIVGALCAAVSQGCSAKYVTPGGPANLADINRADIRELAERRPAAKFPARIALVRVQAAGYKSQTADGVGRGAFTVITVQELFGDKELRAVSSWREVAGVAPLNSLLLPATLGSLDDLRVSAAKVQADVLLVYTIDTLFRVQGRVHAPLAILSLGILPDRDAKVTSTASALFIDVRTGFVYGLADATASASQLTNAWDSIEAVDRKRLEAERQAVDKLVTNLTGTWDGIVREHAKRAARS